MKKRFFIVLVLFLLTLSTFGCIKVYIQNPDDNRSEKQKTAIVNFYPAEPRLVKIRDINTNPVKYDEQFVSVKGSVMAIGKQPSMQIGWYEFADETGTIVILTAVDEIPDIGEQLWVSATVVNRNKTFGQHSVSLFLQEKNKITLQK